MIEERSANWTMSSDIVPIVCVPIVLSCVEGRGGWPCIVLVVDESRCAPSSSELSHVVIGSLVIPAKWGRTSLKVQIAISFEIREVTIRVRPFTHRTCNILACPLRWRHSNNYVTRNMA